MLQTPTNLGNEYAPDIVSAPGDTLQEILEQNYLNQTELAERLGLSQKTVNEIIRGKAPLTHETALGLENVLGIPASFWNSYESAYRESLTRQEVKQRLYEYASWLEKLPWKKAVDLEWLQSYSSTTEQILEVLRFFGVATPQQYDHVYGNLAVQWKRSSKFPAHPGATAFWLRRGENEARNYMLDDSLNWNDYDSDLFEQALLSARKLTLDREPTSFVPQLQKLCASAGVAVVFVPEIEGARTWGATRWLSPSRAVIQLSLRNRTNDFLWFYFFHEGCHVLKHSKKQVFLDSEQDEQSVQENEANTFAENMLIPRREYQAFRQFGKPSKADVERFAKRIGVDPGIVVGRLEKDGVLNRGAYVDLKQSYEW